MIIIPLIIVISEMPHQTTLPTYLPVLYMLGGLQTVQQMTTIPFQIAIYLISGVPVQAPMEYISDHIMTHGPFLAIVFIREQAEFQLQEILIMLYI